MKPADLTSYVNWRRGMFDPKGDLDRIPWTANVSDLLKAASTVGQVAIPPDDSNELELRPLNGGSFNNVFAFDTADGSYVLRVPHSEKLAPGLLAEEWAAVAAKQVHFPTIAPVITDTSHYLVPFSFQILPLLDGKPHEIKFCWLSRIHGIRLEGFGLLNPTDVMKGRRPRGIHDSWASYLTTNLDDHLYRCITLNAMTETEAETASDLINGLQATFDPVLLHNDLSPSNVLGGCVIDWESAIAGDPIFEYASYSAFHADREPLWEVFPSKPSDLKTRFWIYYLRIVLARTVHRARFGLPENGAYPKASARIQLALSHLS